MSDVENALKQALEANPGDWSVRFLIADKMLERAALQEAMELVLDSPSPPESDEDLHRVADLVGAAAVPIVELFVAANPSNGYGHEVLASVLESAGDLTKAGEHRAVAMALASKFSLSTESVPLGSVEPELESYEQHEHSVDTPPDEKVEEEQIKFIPAPTGLKADTSYAEAAAPEEYYGPASSVEEPPKARGTKATAILMAVAFHLAIALIASLVVILQPAKDEPEIVAAVIGPPAKKQEMQKKNVVKQTKKSSASSAAAAPLAQLMRANALAKISLPNVTKTSKGPLGIGDADFGGGGFGSGGQGLGSGASFFGGTSTGQRFLFVLDHSGSMKANQVKLRNDELEKALKSLKGVEYQVLLFAGGGYYASKGWALQKQQGLDNTIKGPKKTYFFKSVKGFGDYEFRGADSGLPKAEWLKSSASNVKATMDRVKKDKLFGGTDWGVALDIAHAMDPPPDVIFFMADGTGGNAPAPILKVNAKYGKPPINMVAMQTTAGIKEFSEIAKKTKGSFTIVDKKGKPIDGFEFQKHPEKFKGRL
jgi:hypothetical protein